MKWTFENGIPIYLQILSRLKSDIAKGDFPPGSKLPPVRELALEAGVNPNTIQRAFAELEREGLVYTQRTSGRFVTNDAEVLLHLKRTLSEEIIAEMCTRLLRLGMTRAEILAAAADWAGKDNQRAQQSLKTGSAGSGLSGKVSLQAQDSSKTETAGAIISEKKNQRTQGQSGKENGYGNT